MTAAGWYLFDAASSTRRRWHYVNAGQSRSRCGHVTTLDRVPSFEPLTQICTYGLSVAAFCAQCDVRRRAEEGRQR